MKFVNGSDSSRAYEDICIIFFHFFKISTKDFKTYTRLKERITLAIALQAFIPEVLGSNSGRGSVYPDRYFSWIFLSLQKNSGIIPRLSPTSPEYKSDVLICVVGSIREKSTSAGTPD
jgi:hypothetical protein